MIDHAAVNVTDLDAAKAFYAKALTPLGYSLAFEAGEFLGFGDAQGWISASFAAIPSAVRHVALQV